MVRPESGRRTLPHLPARDSVGHSIIQFVTVTVAHRRPLLANPESARAIVDAWQKADLWLVGRYLLMPDHLHMFCAPAIWPPAPLKQWMAYWHAEATRHWPLPSEKPIWQKDFFDRQLRSGERYREKWDYVWLNPVRAGLVSDPGDWPYYGELNVLRWHEPA